MRGISPLIILILFLSCSFGCSKSSNQQSKETEKRPPPRQERLNYAGSREIPYQLGKEYKYIFTTDKGNVGNGSFKIEKIEAENENFHYKIESAVNINDEANSIVTNGKSVLIIDKEGNIVHYHREAYGEYKDNPDSNGIEEIELNVSHEKIENSDELRFLAKVNTKGPKEGKSDSFEIEIPRGGFLFDNNYLGLMAYICSQPQLKAGRIELLKVLSVNLHSIITIKMTPKIKVELNYKGQKIIAYEVDMKADDATFGRYFITPEGVLLKAEEMGGLMVIELTNPDF